MRRLGRRIVMWIGILTMQVYILNLNILVIARSAPSEITWRNYSVCGVMASLALGALVLIAVYARQWWKECDE